MAGELQNGMDCTQFEALLCEALDGTLGQPVLLEFRAHAATCADCGPLLAAAQAGMSWVKALDELEPPRNLVRNILIATSGAEATTAVRETDSRRQWRRGWMRPLAPAFAALAHPRFALTLGMAFFSLTLLLNAAGLHLSSLHAADLRPSAIQENLTHTYDETTARAVKYYENIRLFYEIESRVREFQNAARQEDRREQRNQQPEKQERKYRDDNRSGNPEQKQQDRYSRGDEPVVLAGSTLDNPFNFVNGRSA
jgi:Putative zinc-finger